MAPVLGGVLYRKTGYEGVFGLGAALLGLDFIMRILVIEKKVAVKYDKSLAAAKNPREHTSREEGSECRDDASEEVPLLPKTEERNYSIPEGQNRLVRALPIVYCLSNPRLLVAFLLAFVQAALLATFDATLPTEAQKLFDFDSLKAGLLFIALDIPYLLLGPLAGWAVDRYGTKPAAVIGFGYLVPTLVLLRLPSAETVPSQRANIILYCALLSLNGIGLAIIGSPSIVEASDVVQKYDKANPGLFGENGPYAQLYGFNSLVFSAGLTIGPILSGALRDSIGYANMNAVVAAISGLTAVLSFVYVGGRPKILRKRRAGEQAR
jgi:MFS family permease